MGADRFEVYRDRDPVHWHAPSGAWLITRSGDVRRLLADPRLVSATSGDRIDTLPGLSPGERSELAAFYGGWLSLTDGPVHRELRGLIGPLLAPSKVAPWGPVFRELADDQGRRASWDRVEDTFARPYAARVVGAVLGLTPGEFPDALLATGRLLRLLGVRTPSARQAREAHEALAVVAELGRRLVDRAAPPGAPTPLTYRCELPDDVRAAALVQLIGGGYDPLARCLTSYAAAGAPVGDGTGDPAEEVFGLHPPFELLPRVVVGPVGVGEQVLPPGSRVLLAIGSAGRDERGGAHLSFGAGPHRCPAANLARAAVGAATAVLRRHADGAGGPCSTPS